MVVVCCLLLSCSLFVVVGERCLLCVAACSCDVVFAAVCLFVVV